MNLLKTVGQENLKNSKSKNMYSENQRLKITADLIPRNSASQERMEQHY